MPEIKEEEKPIAMSGMQSKTHSASALAIRESQLPCRKVRVGGEIPTFVLQGLGHGETLGDNGMSRAAENYIRRVDDLLEQKNWLVNKKKKKKIPIGGQEKVMLQIWPTPNTQAGSPRVAQISSSQATRGWLPFNSTFARHLQANRTTRRVVLLVSKRARTTGGLASSPCLNLRSLRRAEASKV